MVMIGNLKLAEKLFGIYFLISKFLIRLKKKKLIERKLLDWDNIAIIFKTVLSEEILSENLEM